MPRPGNPRSLPATLLGAGDEVPGIVEPRAPRVPWDKLPSSTVAPRCHFPGVAAPLQTPVPHPSSAQSISHPCTRGGLEGVTEKTLVTFFILFYCLTKHLGLIRITSRAKPEPENLSLF